MRRRSIGIGWCRCWERGGSRGEFGGDWRDVARDRSTYRCRSGSAVRICRWKRGVTCNVCTIGEVWEVRQVWKVEQVWKVKEKGHSSKLWPQYFIDFPDLPDLLDLLDLPDLPDLSYASSFILFASHQVLLRRITCWPAM